MAKGLTAHPRTLHPSDEYGMGTAASSSRSADGRAPAASTSLGRVEVTDLWLQAIIGAFVLAYGVSLWVVARPASGYTSLWDGWIQNLALALPLVPVVLGALRWPERRWAWLMIGLGILLNTVANLQYTYHDQNLTPIPYPALSDIPYVLSYVGFIVGVALMTRAPDRDRRPGSNLDGLIAGLAITALVGLLWFGPVLRITGDPLEAAVGLAYPILDLVLIAVLVTNLIVNRRNLDWSLIMVFVGVLFFVIGDTSYLAQMADGTYVAGTLLDETWVLGIFFVGLAASVRTPRARDVRSVDEQPPSESLLMPVLFGLTSLVVMVVALLTNPGVILSVLVLSSFIAVLARMAITIRALHDAEAASSHDAHTDFLTGLSNRRDLLNRLEVMSRSGESRSASIGMILIDLDGFKEVNDSLGHMAGDELLRIVAARFERRVGGSAVIARLGGDEYACAIEVEGEDELLIVARRLQSAVTEPITLDGMTLRVDASIGLAWASPTDLDVGELLRQADVAMYEAKNGRLGISTYRPDRDPNSRERLELIEELRAAIDERQLVLHYQPTVDMRTGRARGVEALVRWRHPTQGLIMPDDFIPLAERFGLIPRLTRAVIEEAVAELARLVAGGHDIAMSVNISGSDLVDERLPRFVIDTLERHGVPSGLLTLEITESVLANDIDRAQRSIDRLRRHGILISIDDYGVGYSSMSQLLSLHVDELKIDKSFVLALDTDDRASAIVRSAVEFARALGLTVVAEGIETAGVLERLQDLDVDVAQGFFVARPLSANRLHDFLGVADGGAVAEPDAAEPLADGTAISSRP